jgi:hypothetical protein
VEFMDTYSTDSFLMAIRRFMCMRGRVQWFSLILTFLWGRALRWVHIDLLKIKIGKKIFGFSHLLRIFVDLSQKSDFSRKFQYYFPRRRFDLSSSKFQGWQVILLSNTCKKNQLIIIKNVAVRRFSNLIPKKDFVTNKFPGKKNLQKQFFLCFLAQHQASISYPTKLLQKDRLYHQTSSEFHFFLLYAKISLKTQSFTKKPLKFLKCKKFTLVMWIILYHVP